MIDEGLKKQWLEAIRKIDFNDPAVKRSIEGVQRAVEMYKEEQRKTSRLKDLRRLKHVSEKSEI